MKKWIQHQLMILQCHWYRVKYRKELFSIVFYDVVPDMGEVLTDANGTQIMIVESGQRDGNSWVARGYIIHVPTPVSPPTAVSFDFLDPNLPTGTSVIMSGNLWVKLESGDFVLQLQPEAYTA